MSDNIEFKNCPFCGEEIKAVAIKCKHCGSLLNEDVNAETNLVQSEYKDCPFCGEEIKTVAIKCKHCNSFLTNKKNAKPMEEKTEILLLLLFILGTAIIIFLYYIETTLLYRSYEASLFIKIMVVLFSFLLPIIPAFIGKTKGKNYIVWYIYGYFLSVIAMVHAVLLPPQKH